MLWSGAMNRHWKIRKIRYNRPSFKDRDLRHPNLWVGGLLFYEWKPKQLGFLVEKRKAGWTYVMKICKTKKEEVKSPAGSGWASQALCDKLLHLLKPKFFICTKRRPEQGTYIAAPSPGAFATNSQHLFAEAPPPGFQNLLCLSAWRVGSTWEFSHHLPQWQPLTKDWNVGHENTPVLSPLLEQL